MTDLLPCPFCGGAASKMHACGLFERVYCGSCFAQTSGLHTDRDKAIAAWNTRAKPDEKKITDDELQALWHMRDQQWRMIDSAPEWVEVLVKYDGNMCIKSQPYNVATSVQVKPWVWDLGSMPIGRKPTHWMPLPQPPEDTK